MFVRFGVGQLQPSLPLHLGIGGILLGPFRLGVGFLFTIAIDSDSSENAGLELSAVAVPMLQATPEAPRGKTVVNAKRLYCKISFRLSRQCNNVLGYAPRMLLDRLAHVSSDNLVQAVDQGLVFLFGLRSGFDGKCQTFAVRQ